MLSDSIINPWLVGVRCIGAVNINITRYDRACLPTVSNAPMEGVTLRIL